MPTVKLNKKVFEELVGKKLPLDELKDRISMLGTDLEGIEGNEISVEIFPNRPDMLSEQGFARAFSSFIGEKTGLRKYPVSKSGFKLIIDKSLKGIRPHTACSIIRGIKFDDEKIKEIIQIQEKLHVTYGRNRKKCAIGIYPLEKIKFPVTFKALKPEEIKFQPLESNTEMTGSQILQRHPKGRDFAHLMEGLNLYPIFVDANDKILSMPPIINSHDVGKIDKDTTDIFIECSGNDLETQKICLNIIVTAMHDMGGKIESIDLEHFEKGKFTTPDLEAWEMPFDIEYVNKLLGMEFKEKEIKDLLAKMGMGYKSDDEKLAALVPCYRADILHQMDIVEDIAIAYGYENFEEDMPNITTVGEEEGIELFKKRITYVLTGIGLLECYTYHITDKPLQNTLMNTKNKPVELANPSSSEYNVLREWMLPSLMDVLNNNKHHDYPQKIFDIGTVFTKGRSETGVVEKEKLAVCLCEEKSDYTKIRQVLDYTMKMLDLTYEVKGLKHDSFIEGRTGEIIVNKKSLGYLGEISPVVLSNFDIEMPVSALEIDLEQLYELMKNG